MPFPRQQIELVGNLGKPSEMRYTPTGMAVTTFSMAVTRTWGDDRAQKETIWVTVSVWDKLAESCNKLSKGQQVLVKGYLKPDATTGGPRLWKKTDGTPGASYELTAQEVWISTFVHQTSESTVTPDVYTDEIPF